MTLPTHTVALLPVNRKFLIAGGVIAFHMAALWALQSGLRSRPVEVIIPAEILVEFNTPAASKVTPPAPAPAPPKPTPVKAVTKKTPGPAKAPAPLPLAIVDPTPAPTAQVGALEAPVATGPQVVSASPAVVAKAAPTPQLPQLVLPSSDADYLQNPKPPYPALSKRLGEQGKVVVRVLIGIDGTAQKTELKQSSGFDRLDQTALTTVLRWRYVPGKRAGVPEAMWFNVPISFVLE
ncbi:energy transducer TonB [Rhodoferax sp. PAMC 29310]|uniref:energy transducer TonB n=1 Tax=Rhodoferax sp. PAMC 29310 TaxID=2822760 RepID=UPI001B33FE86|nr:energy transducer TonB [Rhodoferax sp. PAMC 29310]